MGGGRWINGPIGAGASRRITREAARTALVLVPHVVAGTRLADLLALFEGDERVQVLFTVPDDDGAWFGAAEYARDLGGLVVPWSQAVRHEFDLVLAASFRSVDRVRGPVLVVPHGAGLAKSRLRPRRGGPAPVHGLDRSLLVRDGRVVAAALCLGHDTELDLLRESCPEAVPKAVVTGDICLDRMVASVPHRAEYRRALGVPDDRSLFTISSTWTTRSVFGAHLDVYRSLTREAAEHGDRVAAVLHPNAWAVHGPWQIRSWLADSLRAGLVLVPPEEGWRAVVVASDAVLGDHGSTTQYAAALGRRTALVPPLEELRPGGLADLLLGTASRFDPGASPRRQLLRAPDDHRELAGAISSRPGQAATLVRRTAYRLLDLPEPGWPAPNDPVPVFHPAPGPRVPG